MQLKWVQIQRTFSAALCSSAIARVQKRRPRDWNQCGARALDLTAKFLQLEKNKKETTPVKVSSHHTGDVTLSTGHTLYGLLCAVPEGVLATL
jgi:hypothetical protein